MRKSGKAPKAFSGFILQCAMDELTHDQIVERLESKGIKVRQYPELEMMLLDYTNDAVKTDPLTIECRSLIVSTWDYHVISRKFDRFFNVGENEGGDSVDFDDAVCYEKADGSLIGVYYHGGEWRISTRGTALAEGPHVMGGTFRGKVMATLGVDEEGFQRLFNQFPSNWTLIFEWISPENRIVTPYKKSELVLLGMTAAGLEIYLASNPEIEQSILRRLKDHNVRACRRYELGSKEAMDAFVANLDDLEEGLIIQDKAAGQRAKLKSRAYLTAHRLRGENVIPTDKNLAELILTGEEAEFIAYFPEWKERVDVLRSMIETHLTQLNETYQRYKDIEDQKAFAMAVKEYQGSWLMFEARKRGLDNIQEVWKNQDIMKQLRLLGFA